MADDSKAELQNDDNSEFDLESHEMVYEGEEEGSLMIDEEFETILEYPEEYSFIAKKPTNGTVPENILEFFYSYAYNCQKYFNICVIDRNTIAFASGNLIHFFNVVENKIWFKRGSMGGGIGHITKNPIFDHIAVGENGINPPITIYKWPSLNVVTILEAGTSKRYFHLAYSPDGLLLASQGGEPDYYISIWNWKISTIVLQCKSHVQDVYNITFSKYIPGGLTSSGSGHIKFWKMSRTFTGLKLKGETGKFGNTEISDIIAIHPMPNETVISGCEWGNILLWDENLIKLEASRKNAQMAHTSYISQFEYINGDLLSVGSDGWIRFWFYETMDHADSSDTERLLQIQPVYEFLITEEEDNFKQDAMLLSIQKQEPDDPENTIWYAQDGNGGLWQLDLCTNKKEHVHTKIFACHAGPIVDMDTAVWGPFIATIDRSGRLHIYNYLEKKLNIVYEFRDIGSQVIWLPCKFEQTGSTLVCAFESGVIRMITIAIQTASKENNIKGDYTRLIQVLKPHTMPITAMSLNISHSLLVTGCEDSTIFTFSIQSTSTYPTIIPIGYVKVPSPVVCMTWNLQEESILLIGCLKGDCVEVQLPVKPQAYTTTTYELIKCNPVAFKFESVKSSIHREILKEKYEKEREDKINEKRKEIEQLRIENPHITIDEEAFLMDIDFQERVLPEIYIPEVPNPVLVAQYGTNDNIWLFMAGFDAGYVYEYPRPLSKKLKSNKPVRSRIIENAKDTEIRNCLFYKNSKYLFMGTQYGELYICKIKEKDPLDFSDFWILPIHDYYTGRITKILLSYDEKMLLTCGHDGNIFSFIINDDLPHKDVEIPIVQNALPLPANVEDIEDDDHPSLEEVITRKEQNRIVSVAEKKKKEILHAIRGLAEEYAKITDRNKTLLPSQQISQFNLDLRIAEDLQKHLNLQKILIQQKLAFYMEKKAIELQKLKDHFITPITCLPFAVYSLLNENKSVHCLRELQLIISNIFKDSEKAKIVKDQEDSNREKQDEIEEHESESENEMQQLEDFLAENYSDLSSGLGLQINQILSKYKEKKKKLIQRRIEWSALHNRKPDLAKRRADDGIFLEEIKRAIGEYNLKLSENFDLTMKKETARSKYKELLSCRNKLHHLRENFNARLDAVRAEKQRLQKEVIRLIKVLKKIHAEIPTKNIQPMPYLPKLNFDMEHPEYNLELEKYTSITERVQQLKRQRKSVVDEEPIDFLDLEHEVLLYDAKTSFGDEAESLTNLVSSSILKLKGHSRLQSNLVHNLKVIDSTQTSWEREMKRSRMWRKIYEQDCILRYINDSYERFEKELDELEEQRLDVVYQCTYMSLNLLRIYEEFVVLKECEATEHSLEQKVKQKSNERAAVILKMQNMNAKIASQEEEIHKLQTKIKEISVAFTKTVSENKFQDFLQKIYKKKYTVAKERNGSVDSITQTSDSSSNESDHTVDSETEHIPFDENICPPGCDKKLYDTAFVMREKRYAYEFHIKEVQKEIELLQKEIDIHTKNLRVIESNLKNSEEDLGKFMMEKQKKLNKIDVTVVLKLNQLQHISDSTSTRDIRDCLIFHKKELSKLYVRIGELQQETHNLKEKRKKSETHLKRINQDITYMDSQIKKLKQEIEEKLIQKFGRKVSILNLYKTVLQRLIYDTKTDVRNLTKNYAKQMKNVKRCCSERLTVLENLIQSNTEKLSFLTVLENEKYKLKKILEEDIISEEGMLQLELEHKTDKNMLEGVLNSQVQQRQLLEYNIENLKMKTRKLPALCVKKNTL